MKCAKIVEPQKIEIMDLPIPELESNQILIKPIYTGICGSDNTIWAMGTPIIPGHEFVGIVADANGSKFKVGDRVTAIEYEPCWECDWCKAGFENMCANVRTMNHSFGVSSDGAMAEYIAVRADDVYLVPENISDKLAVLTEPAAVAMHAAMRAGVKAGSKVLITGAGKIGLLAAACAKALGASYVATTARNPERIAIAEAQPFIDRAFDGKVDNFVQAIIDEAGYFDSVIECSGANALISLSAQVLAPQGTICIVAAPKPSGMEYPGTSLFFCEGTITTSYYFTPAVFRFVLECMENGKLPVEHLVTKFITLDELQETLVAEGTGKTSEVKIAVKFDE